MGKTFLILAPHTDDGELGCGGTFVSHNEIKILQLKVVRLKIYDSIKNDLLDIPDKKIVIFGASQNGIDTIAACRQLKLKPSYVVDNNSGKWGCEVCKLKIFSPEKLLQENKKQLVILVASEYYNDISYQLEKMGFLEGIHYFFALRSNIKNERVSKEVNGIQIGRYTYGYEKHCGWLTALKSIGSFCSIHASAQFVASHPTNYISTHPFPYMGNCNGIEKVPPIIGFPIEEGGKKLIGINSIVVGNDVWLGANTVIMPYRKIGNGAVIGAGAIVTKDVPDYAIVVGAPARVLRYRFNEQQIEILNRVQWWNWDDQTIVENAKYFTNMEAFFKKFG